MLCVRTPHSVVSIASLLALLVGFASLINGCSPQGAAPSSSPGGQNSPEAKQLAFANDVLPILEARCKNCHLGNNRKGGFNMSTRDGALAHGEDGPRIVPGDGASSELIKRVSGAPGFDVMPPRGARLSAEEIATLKTWIDQGAQF
ncbi:MAG: hypothetical protein AMXMBFR4_07420 [Candidatus Hydrogenedentota bacterium]